MTCKGRKYFTNDQAWIKILYHFYKREERKYRKKIRISINLIKFADVFFLCTLSKSYTLYNYE